MAKQCGPCTSPCAPCAPGCQPGFPVGSPGNCAVNAPLFAQGVVGSTIAAQLVPVIVPGMQTAPFNSPTPEKLLIDANTVTSFLTTGGLGEVSFQVFVDNVEVPGSDFVSGFTTDIGDVETSQSTTLVVTVPAGPHIVDVRWTSGTNTVTLDAGNLRVVRLACG